MSTPLHIGLDVGSTTLKIVALDDQGQMRFHRYARHNADVPGTLERTFAEILEHHPNTLVRIALTGSAGMGIAERCNLSFHQEVVAACKVVETQYPHVASLVDIGGEDAKMIFFSRGHAPDMRMNGSCAGGTGAFIDQMAVLLGVGVEELGPLALKAEKVHPIASRCGVFSKTDIQNLLARGAKREDIAASIFHAVSVQVITSLSRGYNLVPTVMLCGGPFSYIPYLREAFAKSAGLREEDLLLPECPEAIPAWGTALLVNGQDQTFALSDLLSLFKTANRKRTVISSKGLPQLFESQKEYHNWLKSKEVYKLPAAPLDEIGNRPIYIGIDSGSTTTKVVVINSDRKIVYRSYRRNSGDPLGAVSAALEELRVEAQKYGLEPLVAGSCVTGYGEDLIRKAFGLNAGMVETLAHYSAAAFFDPEVSFILDIGGQDMKAAFIENGAIVRLEINEACSSGCGSFIETFATSLRCDVASFAQAACASRHPSDLGTRCTVFMNSRVKQSLREGATHGDISAGLGYAVVRNCLHKVLKIRDFRELGDRVMLQGGTMRNPAVSRAFELETGRDAIIPDSPELMGAFGAALAAHKQSARADWETRTLTEVAKVASHKTRQTVCKGCHNLCAVTIFTFANGERYYAGNKCEKVFSNSGDTQSHGADLSEWKYDELFGNGAKGRVLPKEAKKQRRAEWIRAKRVAMLNSDPLITPSIGIPRALDMYEHYPFWQTLFGEMGIETKLSAQSTMRMAEKGAHTVMSDNICFPAKLVHGHILDLVKQKVTRIFLPFVVYTGQETPGAINSFNCPIVSGYSEVVRSAMSEKTLNGIPIDAPTISFLDQNRLKKQCWSYLKTLEREFPQIRRGTFEQAFSRAVANQMSYVELLQKRNMAMAKESLAQGRTLIVLASRPYHTDPLIQHKVSQIISSFGVDVVTEDLARGLSLKEGESFNIHQWGFTNRIVAAARWTAQAGPNAHYVQLTSFGCGPDALVIDEAAEYLKRYGKTATILKVDDVSNIGSLKLRIRSLIESLRLKQATEQSQPVANAHACRVFTEADRHRTILMPWFGDAYSPYLPALFKLAGYKAVNLPPSNEETARFGLRYSNNEICYPATMVVGDFMQAMASGKYNRDEIAFGITQTGGQCRATNYISLVKRALAEEGLGNIPVISVSTSGGDLNEQPGFKISWKTLLLPLLRTLVYSDILATMHNAARVRETSKGASERLFDSFTARGVEALGEGKSKQFYPLLREAAEEFYRITSYKVLPRVGIVGEIFVKYNRYANRGVVEWLVENGIEPVVPALTEFFLEGIASKRVRTADAIDKSTLSSAVLPMVEMWIFTIVRKMEQCAKRFPYYRPIGMPSHEAKLASPIINLNAQFGEGWLIPASFARFAREGINSVLSLQPFGCIANHIVAKGIEKRTKDLYPNLSLLFLDLDSGVSDVNFFNRMHFLKVNAQASLDAQRNGPIDLRSLRNQDDEPIMAP